MIFYQICRDVRYINEAIYHVETSYIGPIYRFEQDISEKNHDISEKSVDISRYTVFLGKMQYILPFFIIEGKIMSLGILVVFRVLNEVS